MSDINILANLNAKQQEIVMAQLSHLAVIAGAGSGKTRVLVHRIAWLLEHEHISANCILAVTFTNKAANELKSRVEKLTFAPVKTMWLGTFHGIAHRFLRLHYKQAGLSESFQILDADDQYRMIRKVQQTLNLDFDKWPVAQSQNYINNKKEAGLRARDVMANTHFDHILKKVYEIYEGQCQRAEVVDFAELLLRSYEVLSQNDAILLHYRDRFRHILVDEFQDTNAIQYAWLKLIAGKDSVITIVGDDDQSIYSWRGAKVTNVDEFQRDFPCQIIRLEQNYRSTQTILSAANAVISHNLRRVGKNLWTEGLDGDLISLYMAFNELDEARYLINQIKEWQATGERLQQMAILYRSNAQSRILEEVLVGANIPYRIYGGLKFFERAEIKDALAYLKLLANPLDDAAFERAVNMPPRGIGLTTLSLVREEANRLNISLWQAAGSLIRENRLTPRANHALDSFLQLIQGFQEETKTLPLSVITKQVIRESGLFLHYHKDQADKAQSRLENLDELVQATAQFKQDEALVAIPQLQAFLSYVALESGETQAEDYEDSVQLMTLHSAKGLEFNIVFLAGMEEGLFPHKMSIEEPDKLEEERRLCYVGMTRARKKLYLSFAEARRVYGNQTYRHRSRFIEEIPSDLIKEVRVRAKVFGASSFSASTKVIHDTGLDYQLGERVAHRNFGEGVVINYEGQGAKARVQVKFQRSGVKWLVAELAKLEKV